MPEKETGTRRNESQPEVPKLAREGENRKKVVRKGKGERAR